MPANPNIQTLDPCDSASPARFWQHPRDAASQQAPSNSNLNMMVVDLELNQAPKRWVVWLYRAGTNLQACLTAPRMLACICGSCFVGKLLVCLKSEAATFILASFWFLWVLSPQQWETISHDFIIPWRSMTNQCRKWWKQSEQRDKPQTSPITQTCPALLLPSQIIPGLLHHPLIVLHSIAVQSGSGHAVQLAEKDCEWMDLQLKNCQFQNA